MKRLLNKWLSREAVLQKVSYRHDDDTNFYMIRDNKAAGYSNTQTAQQNIYTFNSTQLIVRLKEGCSLVMVWLSMMLGGVFC